MNLIVIWFGILAQIVNSVRIDSLFSDDQSIFNGVFMQMLERKSGDDYI